MPPLIRFVGPNHALQIYGVKLVGINAHSGMKLLFTIVLIVALMLLSKLLRWISRATTRRDSRAAFWTRQGIHLFTAVVVIIGIISIWFDNPERLTTALGLVTAGLAFALQRVITALAGYLVILRGHTFNVGDRIVMGGVRGDVIALGFLQTTIMEMGQPPGEQSDEPAMWVKGRQYTGRIVTITNAKIFDEPVYNYTRQFPFIWEEMWIPITYKDDRQAAERILLEAARKHTVKLSELSEEDLKELERRYVVQRAELEPKVYMRLTDNWLQLTVRFIAADHGVRELKNAMSRDILAGLEAAGIGIASATYDVVGFPPVNVRMQGGDAAAQP